MIFMIEDRKILARKKGFSIGEELEITDPKESFNIEFEKSELV